MEFLKTLLCVYVSILLVHCATQQNATIEILYPSSEVLKRDVKFLASDELEGRGTGEEGEKRAAEYIAQRMQSLGLKPMGTMGYYQDFAVKDRNNPHDQTFAAAGDISVRNVIGYLDNGAPTTVVIGGHYDHLGYEHPGSLHMDGRAIHNGADDNASGVAGFLYLAEALKSAYRGNNYLIIGFSGEEYGLWGSNYFTKNPTIPLASINYMLNLDMVGRLNSEGKLSINGVGTSPEWKSAMKRIKVKGISTVTTESGMGASDHTSFYTSGIPAIHFFTGQHEDYHRPSDDEEKINYLGLEKVLKYMLELIEELDDDGRITYTETKDADQQTRRSFAVTLGVMPDYLFEGEGMRIDGVRHDRPAQKAGIVKGDIVIRMGEFDVVDMESYMNLLSKFQPGQTIPVLIDRDGTKLERTVTFD